jgi:hypothetical protein
MKYFKRKDGSVFGKLDSISKEQIDAYIKDDKIRCPKCGSFKFRKLIASPMIHSNKISDASLRSQGIID